LTSSTAHHVLLRPYITPVVHLDILTTKSSLNKSACYTPDGEKCGLAPEAIERFILDQFDQAGLLCISALIEAVRSQTRTVELADVNRVLVQPHWRKDYDSPAL
jgi:hypothetical protein